MTRIIADTTCGIAQETARDLGIPLIPQIINFGEESLREGIDIDHVGFLKRLLSGGELPKTAAPYPGDFIEAFQKLGGSGESLVCVLPSADVSGTVRSAETAKEACPGMDIRIIDTRTVTSPVGSMVLEADRLAKSGASADEVVAHVEEMAARARIYFLVDTLDYLRRGGRIGGASALVGTLLQIKPILTFANGRVDQFERERTRKRALARIHELVETQSARGDAAHLTVMHTGATAEVLEIAEDLKKACGSDHALLMNLGPAIVTHAGPGALAIGFFTPA